MHDYAKRGVQVHLDGKDPGAKKWRNSDKFLLAEVSKTRQLKTRSDNFTRKGISLGLPSQWRLRLLYVCEIIAYTWSEL